MNQWLTVKQLASLRKCSERYILSLIKNGKLQARREGKRWMVFVDDSEQNPEQVTEQIPDNSEVITLLKQQLEEKDNQINKLHQLLAMEMQEKLKLMESLPPPRKSFWDRFRRK